jgi:hypothetical protein
MKRRAFLAAIGLAPFFKWAYRQAKPVPKGWFISEFKHYSHAMDGHRSMILFRREMKVVDNHTGSELQVPH